MISFNFDQEQPYSLAGAPRFLALGKKLGDLTTGERNRFDEKINRTEIGKPESNWGTLGWENDRALEWRGQVQFSESGNHQFRGVVENVAKDIRAFSGEEDLDKLNITERFINLSKLNFDWDESEFTYEDIPKLRMTLFMEQEEGALVFYQYNPPGDHESENAMVEYICPESTDSQYSTDRDRLNYLFPIIPPGGVRIKNKDHLARTSGERDTDFVIKVLTFARKSGVASDLLSAATRAINLNTEREHAADVRNRRVLSLLGEKIPKDPFHRLGVQKYKLHRYDRENGIFEEVDANNPIDPAQKTLLMLHGTFSDTESSYGDLFGPGNTVLNRLMDAQKFDQILAFDHPTVWHDVEDNCKHLYELLEDITFSQSVSLLGYSRGALICKWLSADAQNIHFGVDKILTFSGAYGVGYMSAGWKLQKGLSVLRYIIPPPAGTYISALAQFSVKFVLSRPGLDAMRPGIKGKRLRRIMNKRHRNRHTQMQTVAADWVPRLAHGFRKPFSVFFDAVIKLVLGRKHDWVVGYKEQKKGQRGGRPFLIETVHTKNFDETYHGFPTHQMIFDYY